MSFFRLRLLPIYLIISIAAGYYYWEFLQNLWSLSSQEKFTIYNNFCVVPNVIASKNQETDRITQILHMSSNILDERLQEQVENWNGPVSLALVLIHKESYYCAMEKLKILLSKSDLLKKYLRVHLVFPTSWSNSCTAPLIMSKCDIPKPTIEELRNYPANTARNVARMFAIAKYILIADYEHLFSKNFERDALQLAQKTLGNEKKILIYRIFEIEKGVKEPETKQDLKKLMDKKKAIVFHAAFYHGHAIPRLGEWFAENGTEPRVSEANVTYNRHSWEPQFVSRSDIPMHDLNFPFLIRDNTCLRWELCRAGYQFDIMSDHFMYHKGIKRPGADGGISKKVQAKNSWRFSKALSAFNKRMDAEYPDTKNICPRFAAK